MTKKTLLIFILAITLIIILAAMFASSYPDGLEWVAQKLGFLSMATEEPLLTAPAPDYSVEAIKSEFWSTTTAGILGAAIVFLVVWVIGKFIKPGKDKIR